MTYLLKQWPGRTDWQVGMKFYPLGKVRASKVEDLGLIFFSGSPSEVGESQERDNRCLSVAQ